MPKSAVQNLKSTFLTGNCLRNIGDHKVLPRRSLISTNNLTSPQAKHAEITLPVHLKRYFYPDS